MARWAPTEVDIVVLRGAGPSFSAGLDRRAFTPGGLDGEPGLAELAGWPDDALDAAIAGFQEAFTGWSADGLVTIAAVQGHAIGAGFQLALAADLRIAADDARFSMLEPSLGLVPDLGGTQALVRAVGYSRALEICATGRFVDAAEALAIGLVQQVVPAAALDAAVDGLVSAFMATPRGALHATRVLLRDALTRTPVQQLAAERRAQAVRLRELTGPASEATAPGPAGV